MLIIIIIVVVIIIIIIIIIIILSELVAIIMFQDALKKYKQTYSTCGKNFTKKSGWLRMWDEHVVWMDAYDYYSYQFNFQ